MIPAFFFLIYGRFTEIRLRANGVHPHRARVYVWSRDASAGDYRSFQPLRVYDPHRRVSAHAHVKFHHECARVHVRSYISPFNVIILLKRFQYIMRLCQLKEIFVFD